MGVSWQNASKTYCSTDNALNKHAQWSILCNFASIAWFQEWGRSWVREVNCYHVMIMWAVTRVTDKSTDKYAETVLCPSRISSQFPGLVRTQQHSWNWYQVVKFQKFETLVLRSIVSFSGEIFSTSKSHFNKVRCVYSFREICFSIQLALVCDENV